jgi:hypothetical protein
MYDYKLKNSVKAAICVIITSVLPRTYVLWDLTVSLDEWFLMRVTHPHRTQGHITEQLKFHIELFGKYTLEITCKWSYDVHRHYTNIDLGG